MSRFPTQTVSALNIHLRCLVLDGVYRRNAGQPVFQEARGPSGDELQGLLDRIIASISESDSNGCAATGRANRHALSMRGIGIANEPDEAP